MAVREQTERERVKNKKGEKVLPPPTSLSEEIALLGKAPASCNQSWLEPTSPGLNKRKFPWEQEGLYVTSRASMRFVQKGWFCYSCSLITHFNSRWSFKGLRRWISIRIDFASAIGKPAWFTVCAPEQLDLMNDAYPSYFMKEHCVTSCCVKARQTAALARSSGK